MNGPACQAFSPHMTDLTDDQLERALQATQATLHELTEATLSTLDRRRGLVRDARGRGWTLDRIGVPLGLPRQRVQKIAGTRPRTDPTP